MGLIVLYLSICLIGVFVGKHLKQKDKHIPGNEKVQLGMLMILLFTMGVRLGANKEVVSALGSIGYISLAITLFILTGSVASVYITRRYLGFSKKGEKKT